MTRAFEYEAHGPDGLAHAGRLDAADVDDARRRVGAMGLTAAALRPVPRVRPARPLSGADVLAFNEQLLHLTRAGLPLESGLRLMADDMRSADGRAAVRRLAERLEAGEPPGAAVRALGGALPPLYGRLIEAGAKADDLPGVLLGLNRHLTLQSRLRAAAVRALAYPIVLVAFTAGVALVICTLVLPEAAAVFDDMAIELPPLTRWVLAARLWLPPVLIVALAGAVLWPVVYAALRAAGRGAWWIDQTALRLPLVGPVLRHSAVARWLDAAAVGVRAGLDLPEALRLANDAAGSPRLARDGRAMIASIGRGGGPVVDRPDLLPTAVPAAVALAGSGGDLPATLDTLAGLYRRRAARAVGRVPLVLVPLALAIVAATVALLLAAMVLPLVELLRWL